MNGNIENDLKNSSGDIACSVSRGIISSLPIVGGAATELFNFVITPPLEKRRDQWLVQLANSIEELNLKYESFNINDLVDNELFISVVLQASQIALRNHQTEKLIAMRNAVINTALNIDIDEIEQQEFIRLVDELSVWHLRVLYYFVDPEKYFEKNKIKKPDIFTGSPAFALIQAFPELVNKKDFVDRIIKELYIKGLFMNEHINITMSPLGVFEKRTSEFGSRFIRYISEA